MSNPFVTGREFEQALATVVHDCSPECAKTHVTVHMEKVYNSGWVYPDNFPACQLYEVIKKDEKLDTHAHLPFLKEHAKGNILEIGVHCGISTTALLAGLEENGGHLWSVDTHPSCRYVWYGHPQWTFVCPWSGDEVKLDVPLDVLFIDGDHSREAVAKDLLWGMCVRKGGLILLHDVSSASFPGIRDAIDQYCIERGLSYDIRPGSHGLGVIYV